MDFHEEHGTLADFYPDQSERSEVLYLFAHKFLPQYVLPNPARFFGQILPTSPLEQPTDPNRFIHSRWAIFDQINRQQDDAEDADEMYFRVISDLSMSLTEVAGRPVALIHFPQPEKAPEAYYSAFVLLASPQRPNDWAARYFTLEKVRSDEAGSVPAGLLCEWNVRDMHLNSGKTAPATAADFLAMITDELASPSSPVAAFIPLDTPRSAPIDLKLNISPEIKKSPKPWWRMW